MRGSKFFRIPIVLAIGVLSTLEYALGLNFGFDQIFITDLLNEETQGGFDHGLVEQGAPDTLGQRDIADLTNQTCRESVECRRQARPPPMLVRCALAP